MVSANVTTTVAVTSAAGLVLVAIALWQRKRRNEAWVPEKWRRVGTLTDLSLYPLKSGAVVQLEKGDCTDRGLRTTSDHKMQLQDRLFAVIGPDGNVRTARQHTDLFFIKVSRADETSVTFQAPKMDDLTVSIPKVGDAKKNDLTMWRNEKIPGLDCGDEAAQWVQKYLGKEGLRLLYYAEALGKRDHTAPPLSVIRKIYRNFRPQDSGTYGDYSSYMLMNSASLADLKNRLGDSAPPKMAEYWFRANFVVRGADAYAEDDWSFFRIGENAVFQVTKPCTRCIMTILDPLTGEKTKNMEPLKTLRKYRQVTDPEQLKFELANAPCMGVYVGLRRPGCVSVGDAVYIPDDPKK